MSGHARDGRAKRGTGFLARSALVLLALAAHANTIHSGFVYDDNTIVASNPLVRSLANLPRIFSTGYWGPDNPDSGLYRPLTITAFALDHALWGLHPAWFHTVNILLHAAVTLLAVAVLNRLTGRSRASVLAGAVFAVHPVHVEAVSGIVGRAEILSAGFLLLALWLHLEHARTRRRYLLAGAALAFLMAMLAKETAFVFPLLLLGLESSTWMARGREPPAPRLLPYLAYGGSLLVLLGIRLAVLGSQQALGPAAVGIMDNPLYDLPAAQRLGSAFHVLFRYLLLLMFPIRLSADYSYAQIPAIHSVFDPRLAAALAVAGGAGWVTLHAFGRRPALFTGVALLLGPLLPVSNLLVPIGTIMAERLLYLPVLGFGFLLGLGFDALLGRAAALRDSRGRPLRWPVALIWGLLAAVLAGQAGRTVLRNLDWRDDFTLFTASLKVVPKSSRMHLYLGRQYNTRGRHAEARACLERSLAILPWNPEALSELGYAHLAVGEFEQAARQFRRAVEMNPDEVGALFGLARVYQQQGRYEEARAELWRTVELSPLLLEARLQLGIVAYTLRDFEQAREIFDGILSLDPAAIAAEYFLGMMEREAGRAGEMARRYERVLASARPRSVEDHVYLGLMGDELGLTDKAYAQFAAAVSLNPESPFTRVHLAQHDLRRGAYWEALEQVGRALEKNPFAVEALQAGSLAWLHLGHPAEAESMLVKARFLRPRDTLTALHLAAVYSAGGKWTEAERELHRATAFDPGSGVTLAARGDLERARGEFARAREFYRRARTRHPDSTSVDLDLISTDVAEGNAAAASLRLAAIARREGLTPRHHFEIACLLESVGRVDEADRFFRAARSGQPRNGDFMYRHAEMLVRQGRYDEAEPLLRELLSLYPSHGAAMNALAWLLLQRPGGDAAAPAGEREGSLAAPAPTGPAQALQLADAAIAVDATVAAWHDTRGEALQRLGRLREALAAWREAARLDPANPDYAARAAGRKP